jgi:hypothetical protein
VIIALLLQPDEKAIVVENMPALSFDDRLRGIEDTDRALVVRSDESIPSKVRKRVLVVDEGCEGRCRCHA